MCVCVCMRMYVCEYVYMCVFEHVLYECISRLKCKRPWTSGGLSLSLSVHVAVRTHIEYISRKYVFVCACMCVCKRYISHGSMYLSVHACVYVKVEECRGVGDHVCVIFLFCFTAEVQGAAEEGKG